LNSFIFDLRVVIVLNSQKLLSFKSATKQDAGASVI